VISVEFATYIPTRLHLSRIGARDQWEYDVSQFEILFFCRVNTEDLFSSLKLEDNLRVNDNRHCLYTMTSGVLISLRFKTNAPA
jgi:hypothetical protein